jgi:hypothetical protein
MRPARAQGNTNLSVYVEQIEDGGVALCVDRFGDYIRVDRRFHSSDSLPVVGQQWFIERDSTGYWVFSRRVELTDLPADPEDGQALVWNDANRRYEPGTVAVDAGLGEDEVEDIAQGLVDEHVNDASDAHDAAAISFAGASGVSASDVEGAIDELAGDITTLSGDITTVSSGLSAHLSDTTDSHDAESISVVPFGSIAATDVQEALEEIAAEAGAGGAAPIGPAGGVLDGSYPNPTFASDMATQAELDAVAAAAADADNLTSGTVAEARIHADIARDSEVTAAVAAEAALARNADNLTSGTVAEARIHSDIARDSEVDAAIAVHVTDPTGAHAASAISYAGGTGISATDVEAAIDELANEKMDLVSGASAQIMSGGSETTASNGTGVLQIGASSGANIGFDSNEIQARSGGSTSTLNLNPAGGTVSVGGILLAASTNEATLTDGTGAFQSGPSGGANIAIDRDEIQARSGSAAATLNIQPHGGTTDFGGTISISANRVQDVADPVANQDAATKIWVLGQNLVPNDSADPATPTGLALTPGVQSVFASWAAPVEVDMINGFGSWLVEIDENSDMSSPFHSREVSARFCSFTGLAAGVTYYVRVKAIDAWGNDSAFTAAANTTTLYVTNDDIAVGTINADRLVANSITANEIATDAVTANEIAAGTITAAEIQAATITAAEIAAGTITSVQIDTGTIVAGNIAAGTITTDEIAAGTIEAINIAANTITSAQIAANTITAAEIDTDAITADEIAAGTITTTEIAANTITAADIAAGTITSTEIAANTIQAGDIAANTITATEIATDAITADEIAAGTITSTEIATGTITAVNIAANTITADEIDVLELEVGQYIESDGYVTGTTGWHIDADGDAEFNDIVARGEVEVSRIEATLGSDITTNGSFTTDTTGWAMSLGSIARDTGTFDTTPASAKITVDATTFEAIGAYTEADPNESGEDGTYVISAKVKFETAGDYTFTLGNSVITALDNTTWWPVEATQYVKEGDDLVVPFEFLGQASTDDVWIDSVTIKPKGRLVGELTGDFRGPLPDGRSASLPRGKVWRKQVTTSSLTVTAGGGTILTSNGDIALSADRLYRVSCQAGSINMDSSLTQWTLRLRWNGTTYATAVFDSFNNNTELPASFFGSFSPTSDDAGTFSLTGNRSAGAVGGAQLLRGDAQHIAIMIEDIGPG